MISPPRHLSPGDDLAGFDCGVAQLNNWLHRWAMVNHLSGASRCYVCTAGGGAAAFYCLSASSIGHEFAAGNVRRNMPDPIPAILLGQLAVDKSLQGQGVGAHLVHHAAGKCMEIASLVGVRVLLVHALDDSIAKFYQKLGFVMSPHTPRLLMARVKL